MPQLSLVNTTSPPPFQATCDLRQLAADGIIPAGEMIAILFFIYLKKIIAKCKQGAVICIPL
jgi:hypothetical protein